MRSLFALWSIAAFPRLVFAGNGFEEGHAAHDRQECVKAFEILRPLEEGGNADAQNIVGRMHSLGQGVPKDKGEAMKWITLSGENGNLEAQEALAALAIMNFTKNEKL